MATKSYVFADLNVRDALVSKSEDVLLYDTKDIIQSLWRLLTTQEGEIPNFRDYGIDVKQFLQYPLTDSTIRGIYNYVKGKVATYEKRVDLIRTNVSVSFETGEIRMVLFARLKASGEVIALPTWVVQVATV